MISNYEIPDNISEAYRLITDSSKISVVLSGGTILTPLIAEGGANIDTVVDISNLRLNRIDINDKLVLVGSCTTISQLATVAALGFLLPVVRNFGAPAIRNLASLGGNIIMGGDMSAALLALDTTITLHTREGGVTMSLIDMYERDDLNSIILLEISFSLPVGRKFGFYKLARRLLNSHSVVSAAVCESGDGITYIGLSGVAKKPLLLNVPSHLFDANTDSNTGLKQAIDELIMDVELSNDSHASSKYRRRMVPVAIKRAIDAANIE